MGRKQLAGIAASVACAGAVALAASCGGTAGEDAAGGPGNGSATTDAAVDPQGAHRDASSAWAADSGGNGDGRGGGSDATSSNALPDATVGDGAQGTGAFGDGGTEPLTDTGAATRGDTGTGLDGANAGCPGPCAGTVVGGRCVTTLATNQLQPRSITSDGVTVFWATSAPTR